MLVLATGLLLFRSESPGPGDSATASAGAGTDVAAGEAGIGSAPRRSAAPAPGTRPVTSGTPVPGVPVTPTTTSSATTSLQPVAPGKLAVTYQEPGILGGKYEVTLANRGQTDVKGWTVSLRLTGVGVSVQPGEGVTDGPGANDMWHVFTPGAALETVPARGTVTFTFVVQGVLPSIDKCMVGDEPCTSGT